MGTVKNKFGTGDNRLVLTFLAVTTAFILILIGISISQMWICRAGLLLLIGALLHIPLWNRVFEKRKNIKSN